MNKLPPTDSAVETHLKPRRDRTFSPNELWLVGKEIDRALQGSPTSDQSEGNAVQVLGGRRQASIQPERAACLKFLLLTGARFGDASKIEWDNIYLERRLQSAKQEGPWKHDLSIHACDRHFVGIAQDWPTGLRLQQ